MIGDGLRNYEGNFGPGFYVKGRLPRSFVCSLSVSESSLAPFAFLTPTLQLQSQSSVRPCFTPLFTHDDSIAISQTLAPSTRKPNPRLHVWSSPPPRASRTQQFRGRRGSGIGMAYVDHTFSIRDDDTGTFIVHNGPPIKEIALAVSLLTLGLLGMVIGIGMAVYQVGGDSGHGIAFAILGALLFMPGFYYTRIAYYAYKGYKGFSFSNIPAV